MMMLHKFNRRLLNGGLLAAIAVVGLAGCGGSSGGNVPRRDTVALTGGAESQAVTIDNAAPANPAGQTISINNGTDTAWLAPTTQPVAAGSTIVIVPENTQFFSGLTRSASRAPGNIYVNGVNSGISVDENGQTDGNIAVVNGQSYSVFVEGPFAIIGNGKRLDISEGFDFNVVVRGNVVSLPFGIDGTIPSNGGTASDMFLSVAYPEPFVDDTLTLMVKKSNGNVEQSRVLSPTVDNGVTAGFATFRDFVPSVTVPAEGVQRVSLTFQEN